MEPLSVELSVIGPAAGCGPVTAGLPFPRGALADPQKLTLTDATGKPTRLQARTTDRWPDGSARWALLDWIAEAGKAPYRLAVGEALPAEGPTVIGEHQEDRTAVSTGTSRMELSSAGAFHLRSGGATAGFQLTDADGATGSLIVARSALEEAGPVRVCLHLRGRVGDSDGVFPHQIEFESRLHFFAGSGAVRVEFTIRNPRRAAHPGGLWDLGDSGSAHLAGVAFTMKPPAFDTGVRCSPELGAPAEAFSTPFELYQDSSGGENWRSTNHLTAKREMPVSFRGYNLKSGQLERAGLRATPLVTLSDGERGAGVAVPQFWQNFPMAVEATSDTLTLRLLPTRSAGGHELQGGEQKTWAFAVALGPDATPEALEWFRTPARAFAPPEWYCNSGAIPYLTPKAADPNTDYLKLVDAAVEGADTFDAKRERIDEYGWRHFGDIYGDHEAVYHDGPQPMVSHYNNQYDPVLGFALQFMRSGNLAWLRHMGDLAQHVIDIDIYHTTQDKSAYNGGLFWHTYHYADADTGTHRSYPRSLLQMKGMPGLDPDSEKAKRSKHVYAAGGGPANEHNYATGLMLHYFLTGSAQSREAALGLARWVIDMDDGSKTVFRWLSRGDTGRASMSRDDSYHGPGRGSGNSLSALVDGHRLSGAPEFLRKAEQLVRRCVHPADDVPRRNLLDVENRWFYTMFLHALGKYLDHKSERGELDAMYAYARASLLRYARWMAEHEVPTLSRPEVLEYPNETWAGQDMRKSEVLSFAAKHAAGEEKARFLERAEFFFRDSVSRLTAFPTRTLARPVVLLLSLGYMRAHFQLRPEETAPAPKGGAQDFGKPEVFIPQKALAKKRAKLLVMAGAGLGALGFVALAARLVLK
ncbi:MAG: hypothetical protein ACKODX_06005 [Gemmata sp.]